MGKRVLVVLLLLAGAGAGAWYFRGTQLRSAQAAAGEFCKKHQLPEADCPFCDKSLIKKLGECREHGVPEALCWKCNPRLIPGFKASEDWCAEHSAPESLCPICSPQTQKADAQNHDHEGADPHGHSARKPASRPATGVAATAPASGVDLRNQRPPSDTCENDLQKIQLKSAEAAARAGLRVVKVEEQSMAREIAATAQIQYDARRYARIAARSAGVIVEVHKELGDEVRPGDALVTIECFDLADLKADYLQAVASVDLLEKSVGRKQTLAQGGLTPGRDLLETESRLNEARIARNRARQKLQSAGLRSEAITELVASQDTSARLTLTSPIAGTIVERTGVAGESVEAARPLVSVADTSLVWAILQVPEEDSAAIRPGCRATIRIDSLQAEFTGPLTWVSTQIEPHTRTLAARIELKNPEQQLRANMSGAARIEVGAGQSALLLPMSAVQWDGCCNLVFLRQSEMTYQPRKVALRQQNDKRYEVLDGLVPGDEVVTEGSFLLKTELLKSQIGDGCCAHDTPETH